MRAAQVLATAQRPLIIAGGGCVDATNELAALAQAIGAPVATTVSGKGALDEGHPLSVGAALRLRALQAAAAASDALVVVGTQLGDSDLWEGRITGGTVVRIDIEAGQLQNNCRADVTLLADAAEALWAVLTALPTDRPAHGGPDGAERAAQLRAECRAEARADAGSYEAVNAAVRAGLPADGVLTGDSSQVTYFGSVHFFDVPGPRQFCYTPGFATLGYGVPAGVGASLGRPDTPVATLLGDGAFMFSVQELATAVELRLPLPIVVLDNGGYREIRDQQASRGIAPVGVDLQVPDLALLATAIGAHGVRTKDPATLSGLVHDALGADRPTVIHLDWTE